jgi:coenzyme F420-reducing hydrogenase beta subunit
VSGYCDECGNTICVCDEPEVLTEEQLDRWLLACLDDPAIVHPREVGYLPDGTHKRRRK